MSDISDLLIKNSFDYVLQSDLSSGIVYRIGGSVPVNPIFSSGLTINKSFRYQDGSEINGHVLTSDSTGNATWKPISGGTGGTTVTGGTFDYSTKTLTLYNSDTTSVAITGLTDTYVTGGTISGTSVVFTFNDGSDFILTGITPLSLFETYTANTQNILSEKVNKSGDTMTGTLYVPTISATTYLNLPNNVTGLYLPLSGGTVTGDTIFQQGITATTISATTYLNVNAVTGGTYSNGTITLSGTGNVNVNTITGLTKYFISASTPTGVTIYNGDRWYNTNNGIELVYIDDGNSSQWVQPSNTPGPPGYSNLMITTGITTSAATLDININYYGVNYNGQVNLTLPNPSGYDGYNFTIKDEGGYAATHRIRLIPSSGLIDGNNYVDINLRYVALHLMARNNNWWII
jgi:hypothetical protein